VKSSGSPVGPGPNTFGDTADDVWLDGSGNLHMRIEYRDGTWHSSEVIGDDVLGYGTYTFTLGSRVDLLDRNIVVGLFSWDSSAPTFNYREIDIEFSRWGDPLNENSQYVVQPWDSAGNTQRWETTLAGDDSTHAFTWRPDRVDFSSHQGSPPGALIQSWSYTGPDVPPEGATSGNARINFWLMGGSAPFDGQEAELVINSFDFTPLPANNPPTAAFSHDCTELDCNFTDASSDSDGSIASWSWDFGDSNGSTAQNPSHSYAAAGTYSVELTVTDDQGATGTSSSDVTVSVTPAFVDVVANTDIPGAGSVNGTFVSTQSDNETAQSVTERESSGKKSSRYSYLVHTWQFSLPVNAMATVNANVWSGGSSDDDFAFSWSTDNIDYTQMFVVSSTESDNEESYMLPSGSSGTIYIRVEDTDQTPENRVRDTVFIDHLYIRADSGAGEPPAAPSTLSAVSGGSDRIDLAWADNASDEAGFRVTRSTDAVNFTEVGNTASNDTVFTDIGLTASTTYHYRVLAWNPSGDSAWSNVGSATTDAPPPVPEAPSGLLATESGADRIDLSWVDGSGNETEFQVERSLDGSGFSTAGTTAADVTTFSDIGLNAGTTYWYRVRASNVSGSSGWSNIDNATTEEGPDITLSLNGRKSRGKHEVDLSWGGTTAASVEIYRDGPLLVTVANTGAYTDRTGNKGGRTYDYQVCEAGTAICSAVVSVTY
jgi:PKD repeat protein